MSASATTARAIRRALALLEAASADWRARGPSDGSSPLYWPIAVRAARAQLEHALGGHPTISQPPAGAESTGPAGITTTKPL